MLDSICVMFGGYPDACEPVFVALTFFALMAVLIVIAVGAGHERSPKVAACVVSIFFGLSMYLLFWQYGAPWN